MIRLALATAPGRHSWRNASTGLGAAARCAGRTLNPRPPPYRNAEDIEVEEAGVTFIVCGQLADERVPADRLAPAVQAGIMPAPMVAGWEAGARSLYFEQPWRQRDVRRRHPDLRGACDGPGRGADDRLRSGGSGARIRSAGGRDPGHAAGNRACTAGELAAKKPRRPLADMLQFL
jgi:hypothetical protein